MDPNRKITKKFTKKFDSKVINRQYFHRKTGLQFMRSDQALLLLSLVSELLLWFGNYGSRKISGQRDCWCGSAA